MQIISKLAGDEQGSALIFAILILALLTILGISSSNTSIVESMISGNDTLSKMAFQQADGGTQAGIELLEQNIENRGFDTGELSAIPGITVNNTNLFLNTSANDPSDDADTSRDAYMPKGGAVNQPHTNLTFGGIAGLSTGSAIQMAAGYEGKGKSAGNSGAWIIYDIRSARKDVKNAEAKVRVRWRHVI